MSQSKSIGKQAAMRPLLIGGQQTLIRDFGPQLNEQHIRFCDHMLVGSAFDVAAFKSAVFQFLDAHLDDWRAHNNYFESFYLVWTHFLGKNNWKAAESIWEITLDPVRDWENARGKRAHKGTPYYWWAATVLLAKDIDRGFLLMHRALKEDVETTGNPIPDSPGNYFVTLDYVNQKQWFRGRVEELAHHLENYLRSYREQRGRYLSLPVFRAKFLSNPDLRPAALFFVFLLNKLEVFEQNIKNGLTESDFAGLLELDLLFGICLVSDQVIKKTFPTQAKTFLPLAAHLLHETGSKIGEKELKGINAELINNFGNAVTQVLAHSIVGLNLSPTDADVALCYAIRNRGAHNIEGHESVYENFAQVRQRLMNVLFLAVEILY